VRRDTEHADGKALSPIPKASSVWAEVSFTCSANQEEIKRSAVRIRPGRQDETAVRIQIDVLTDRTQSQLTPSEAAKGSDRIGRAV
jgi:hypothetical protein